MTIAGRFRSVRRRAVVERDLRRLARTHGRALGEPAEPGAQALVVSLAEWPYQLKLEGMLAKALQLQGCEPIVVIPSRESIARRYFEVFGVRRFATIADYLDADGLESAERTAKQLLASVERSEELKRLEFRGAAVGRLALSTASRYTYEGRADLDNPQIRSLVRQLLPRAVQTAIAADALLDELEPDVVLFNERNYSDQGPISDLALLRELNVIQFVQAYQDDALTFKRYTTRTRGLHPRSLSDETWELVRALPWTEERQRELDEEFRLRYDGSCLVARRTQEWTRRYACEELMAALGLDPARRTAVLFSHVLWDANMFYGRDLFADQEEWFVETVRAACANDRVNWILKLHPSNVLKLRYDGITADHTELAVLRERIGPLPPHVSVLPADSPVSTWSVFEVADYGITIRGSIGIELPCFGVPVLTAGTGFYSGRGFTIDSESADEYLERLRTIEEIPPLDAEQVELARKHAHAIFRLRPLRFTSFHSVFAPLERVGHPLDHDLEIALRTPEDLEGAEDLRRFGEWAVRSRELDYLEPLPATR